MWNVVRFFPLVDRFTIHGPFAVGNDFIQRFGNGIAAAETFDERPNVGRRGN